jgi:divalent anion:Na+ symporter, DASS family
MKEEGAWQTLIWFACLMMMASNLNKLGFTKFLSEAIASNLTSVSWLFGFLVLTTLYFVSHYLFASCSAHVSAMYSAFLVVLIDIGAPPMMAALALAFMSSLMGGLTHYGIGPAPLLFGSGYIKLTDWWLVGVCVGVCNLVIWIGVGGAWWWLLGLSQ